MKTITACSTALLISAFITSCSEDVEPVAPPKVEKEAPKEEKKETKPDYSAILEELRDKESDLQKDIKKMQSKSRSAMRISEESASELAKLNEARDYMERLKTLNSQLQAQIDIWGPATRGSFAGIKLDQVATADGQSFNGVEIVGVTAEDFTFTHRGGSEPVTVKVANLPLGLRKNLLHPETALQDYRLQSAE